MASPTIPFGHDMPSNTMYFTPREQPPKEGRVYPGGLPYGDSSPPGWRIKPKQAMLYLVLLICLIPILFLLFSSSSYGDGSSWSPNDRGPLSPTTPQWEPKVVPKPLANGYDSQGDNCRNNQASFKASNSAKYHQPQTPQAGTGKDYNSNTASEEKPVYPGMTAEANHKAPSTDGKPVWKKRPRFETALAKVVNALPSEMHMRDLLRPVEGTGTQKLREMGFRTRAYKNYFEAWEDLHLENDAGDSSYVRDDVVQYLRSHHRSQVQEDMLVGNSIVGLESMDLAEQIRSYENYRYFLAKFGQMLFPWTAPYFGDHMSLHAHFKRGGRGIVLTAGDEQAPYLLTSISIMRELGCKLPVEVMYLGDNDLSEDFRSDLEAMEGVITRDMAQMVNDEGWRLAGWAGKPFAILFSSFREVIFIDADSLFFKNPEVLFDDPGYKKTGALFFKDRMITPENKKRMLQQILPKPISRQVRQSRFWTGDSGHMQESGVVVVDKWRHFMAMLMVTRMNGPDRDGNKDEGEVGVYDLVFGDKETFWLGWELVGDPHYVFHGGDAGVMGDLDRDIEIDTFDSKSSEDEEEGDEELHIRSEHDASENKESNYPASDDYEDNQEPKGQRSALPKLPSSYTLCSPQLLHLDHDNNPLWFNGWLLDNKFADKHKKKFGTFVHYLAEPKELREPTAWQLHENNACCLTADADKMWEFSKADKRLLERMMARARDVGAPGA